MPVDSVSPIAVAVSYSTVSAIELLTKVLPKYAIDVPTHCHFWQRGVNDTYIVRCGETRYSLRVYRHALRTREAIEFELAALEHLRQGGVSVAYAIEKKSGGYITEVDAPEGRRYVIVTQYAAGSDMTYKDPEEARLFGVSAASLHHASDSFSTNFKRPRLELEFLLEESLCIVRPYLSERPSDLEFIDETANILRARVQAAPKSSLDRGLCHGDFHGGNVHRNGSVLTHYDFDCCGMGYRAFDLATFKWSAQLDDKVREHWLPFLDGYRSIRTISATDFEVIDAFVGIRHIWLMALHMGNADDFGHNLTSDGYLDYQLKQVKKLLGDG